MVCLDVSGRSGTRGISRQVNGEKAVRGAPDAPGPEGEAVGETGYCRLVVLPGRGAEEGSEG